ncbi:MAG TPA: UDP-3-O-(3-hydroxymyristoyl)glucosamine N-acyltransferase, partial [Porticoccaceae bacterium]|nr:UDP-3-O-(3-hydroxymyristoyl)glucosamine N-acyltransferase [Porticoccaceae bacterium]
MKRDFSLGEIAAYLDAELHGEPDLRVRALNTLQDAQAGELAFLANEKYVAHLGESRAEAVI